MQRQLDNLIAAWIVFVNLPRPEVPVDVALIIEAERAANGFPIVDATLSTVRPVATS